MRLSNPPVRVVLAVCLFATAPATGASLFGGPPEPGMMPSRFIKVEALDMGLLFPSNEIPGLSARLAKLTYESGRFRGGLSLADGYGAIDEWNSDMMLPVHIGFTVWSSPKQTWLVFGEAPDVYVEASGSPWGPALRVALCCDVDYYGLGARLEGGVLNLNLQPQPPYGRTWMVYAGLQFRILTFSIGF